MRALLIAVVAQAVLVTAADAQTSVGAPSVQPDSTRMSGDAAERFLDRQGSFNRMSESASASARLSRPVPAKAIDVQQGLSVRDAKGVVIGTIARLGSGFAVVGSSLGSVEVDFGSFAKNKDGLLINMPKAKIDAMMAGGKPTP